MSTRDDQPTGHGHNWLARRCHGWLARRHHGAASTPRAAQAAVPGPVSHANEALLTARRVGELHRGQPLVIAAFDGVVYAPAAPIVPGTPVIELIAQSDGLLAVSSVRDHPLRRPIADAFFAAPFTRRDCYVIAAWVAQTLQTMRAVA